MYPASMSNNIAVQQVLKDVGFTNNEVKVYLTLLEMGSETAGKMAKRADLHRRPAYDALNRLVEKGVVVYAVKGGVKNFHAVNPQKILDMLNDRRKEVKGVLPELMQKYSKQKPKINSEVYEGREGIKTIMGDILRQGKEFISIGATGKGPIMFPYHVVQFTRERVKKGIKRKVLIADTGKGRKYAMQLEQEKLVKVRFLPKGFENPQTTWVYADKVVIILVSGDYPIANLIANKEIADSYREYFRIMWGGA